MKTHARVVVIGGGVVGVSTLYHLAQKGWSDVVLVERAELTAGSTWHAAGLLPLFNMSYTVGQLHKYSVDLYKRLPGRDRPGRQLSRDRQPAARDLPRAHGRIPEVLRHGEHDRRAVPGDRPARGQGTLAAGRTGRQRRYARDHRRALSPARRPYRARGPDDGAAQGRALTGRGDLRTDGSDRGVAEPLRRMAAEDQQGRHHRGACRLRDRELRAPDRAHVRAQHAGHPGRAPVHRL